MISAIVLAAGQSHRMGQPKMLLPWGNTTVLGQVILTLQQAGIQGVLVITGGDHEQVAAAARGMKAEILFNEHFHEQDMLTSIQLGLKWQPPEIAAALICLGDQPQIQETTVRRVCNVFTQHGSPLVVPSYHMRRGHPWLVARQLWDSILGLGPARSPRDFLNNHQELIEYEVVESSTVIEDLDTPEDYLKFKPPHGF